MSNELPKVTFKILEVNDARATRTQDYIAYAVIKYKEKEEKQDRECKHKNTTPEYDYVSCNDCGAIKTDSGSVWGIAKNKWFNSEAEAKFYKNNGYLPKELNSSK